MATACCSFIFLAIYRQQFWKLLFCCKIDDLFINRRDMKLYSKCVHNRYVVTHHSHRNTMLVFVVKSHWLLCCCFKIPEADFRIKGHAPWSILSQTSPMWDSMAKTQIRHRSSWGGELPRQNWTCQEECLLSHITPNNIPSEFSFLCLTAQFGWRNQLEKLYIRTDCHNWYR